MLFAIEEFSLLSARSGRFSSLRIQRPSFAFERVEIDEVLACFKQFCHSFATVLPQFESRIKLAYRLYRRLPGICCVYHWASRRPSGRLPRSQPEPNRTNRLRFEPINIFFPWQCSSSASSHTHCSNVCVRCWAVLIV